VQDSQHEKIITVSEDGVVHSPEFPRAYPRNKVLVWRLIAVDEGMQIQLTFDERFGLEDPEDGICKYDFVEIEEPADGTILGRWCGSKPIPGKQVSKGNQIRIHFISDEYFPSEPGFCIHYSLLPLLSGRKISEMFRSTVMVLQIIAPVFSSAEKAKRCLRWFYRKEHSCA
ncbi:UNVERIFIED_CONTAM: hypothetical protein FKN15_044491, partial [Acipenser sinensis]